MASETQESHVTVTTVLALVTFGDTTKNRNDPICVVRPKVAKANSIVTVYGRASLLLAFSY